MPAAPSTTSGALTLSSRKPGGALERTADRYEDRLDELVMEGKHPLPVFGMLRALCPEKWADKQDVRVTHRDASSVSLPPLVEQEMYSSFRTS